MVRLKRRSATSKGSFSFTRIVVIRSCFPNGAHRGSPGRSGPKVLCGGGSLSVTFVFGRWGLASQSHGLYPLSLRWCSFHCFAFCVGGLGSQPAGLRLGGAANPRGTDRTLAGVAAVCALP